MQARNLLVIAVLLVFAAALPTSASPYGTFEARPGRVYKLDTRPLPAGISTPRAAAKAPRASKAPAAVDLSSWLPPVGDQGSLNSGVAWAATYYYKTYQEAREYSWSPATTGHQYSPTWTYNQGNNGQDSGIAPTEALTILCNKGATTLAQQPYTPTDYLTWPTLNQYLQAMPARAQSAMAWWTGFGQGGAYLQDLKDHLAAGDPVIFYTRVYSDFYPSSPSYLYNGPGGGASYQGMHGLCIVGYDDTIGGVGGFKAVNSWGTDWGDGGYCYLSYNFVSQYVYQALAMVDRVGYTPQAWAKIMLQHPRRADLEVSLGTGDVASPTWQTNVYLNQGGNGDNVYCYVDVTDVGTVQGNWWLKVKDESGDATGTLHSFSLITGETETPSADPPLAVTDFLTTVARLQWTLQGYTVRVTTPSGADPLTAANCVTVSYTNLGVPAQVNVWDGKQEVISVDSAGAVIFSETSTGSTGTERWVREPSVALAGVSKDTVLERTYYHQYKKLFQTNTQTPPAVSSDNSVLVTYQARGLPAEVEVWDAMEATAAVWADRGSAYSFARTSSDSGSTARWCARPAPSGTVENANQVTGQYWYQLRPALTFTGTDAAHLTRLTARTLFGVDALEARLVSRWTEWVDSGSELAVSRFTSGTPVRTTSDTNSWTVTEDLTASVNYAARFTVSGMIRDRSDNPVADVTVAVGGEEAVTDATGHYAVHGLPAGTYTIVPTKVGQAFSPTQREVTVDEESGDSGGNLFRSLSVPAVTQWAPRGTEVAPTLPVRVTFSQKMNAAATESAFALQEVFTKAVTYGAPVAGTFEWSADGTQVLFRPASRLKAYRSYQVLIGPGARTAAGAPLGIAFSWTFQTRDCLALTSYSPAATGKAACNSAVVMEFDRDVNRTSVRNAFSLNPAVAGTFGFTSPRVARFTPDVPLPLNTTYTVKLAASARGLDGVTLVNPFSWSFVTQGPAQVLSATPTGNAVSPASDIVVTFDRAMDRELTSQAFVLIQHGGGVIPAALPPVAGTVSWNDRSTVMTFRPRNGLLAATRHTIVVGPGAISMQGAPLAGPFASDFTTADVLQVAYLDPRGSGTSTNAKITVIFNRPVEPETFALTLDPATQGALQWTDASTVVFTPSTGLNPQTRYTATIADTLQAVDGTTLPGPRTWVFNTHGPTSIVAYTPRGADVKPNAAVTVTFDREMDPTSVGNALQLWLEGETRQQVPGTFSLENGGRTAVLRPLQRLASREDYRVTVAATALSVDGQPLASALEWMFQTLPSVQIAAYAPTGQSVSTGAPISVRFDRDMVRSSVESCFRIEPAVAGRFESDDNTGFRFVPVALARNTIYRVTVGAATRAQDGLTLVAPFSFEFKTAPAAQAALVAPTGLSAMQAAGGSVSIAFTLAAEAQVEVQVLNLAGRTVAVLAPGGTSPAGANVRLWNGAGASGSRVPAGTYLIRVLARSGSGVQAAALVPLQLK